MKSDSGFLRRFAYSSHGHALLHSLNYLQTARIATLVTLLVLGISLALPAIFGLFVVNMKQIDVSSDEANSITLYLHTRVSDLRGVELAGEVQQREDILSTRYISRDEALEMFRKHSTLADAAETLDDNPLPGAIVAVMTQSDNNEMRVKLLSDELSAIQEVDIAQYDLSWLKRLHALLGLISRAVWLIGALLLVTALLVIGNTIRLEMIRRADEIEVSRLIGASPSQIRRPFLYSGVMYGIAGGILAILLVSLVIGLLSGPANTLSGLYDSPFKLQGLSFSQCVLILTLSTLVGVSGAWLVVRWQIARILAA